MEQHPSSDSFFHTSIVQLYVLGLTVSKIVSVLNHFLVSGEVLAYAHRQVKKDIDISNEHRAPVVVPIVLVISIKKADK